MHGTKSLKRPEDKTAFWLLIAALLLLRKKHAPLWKNTGGFKALLPNRRFDLYRL